MSEAPNGTRVPFDLASVRLTRTETGSPFRLFHPGTQMPLLDEDGKQISILLLGQYSVPFQEMNRKVQLARAKYFAREAERARIINEGKTNPDDLVEPEPLSKQALDADDTDELVACTVGWTIKTLDGRPFLFSEENARKLWTDKGFSYWREPAIRFILADGNFLAEGSTSSSDTPGTSSGS